MNRIVLITSILLFHHCIRAQESGAIERPYGAEFRFGVGADIVSFNNLNSRLQAAGISQVSSGLFQMGLGVSSRLGPVIIGTDLDYLTGTGVDEVSGTDINFYFSTNELRTHKWIFSPEVGICTQYVTVRVSQTSAATTFADALSTTNQTEVTNLNTMLNMAMAFKRSWGRFYTPLFRLGYRYGLSDGQWEVSNANISDGPRDRLSNFYLEVCFGLGE